MKNEKPLYIFLHIMKCAGTTIRFHKKENLDKDEFLLLYYNEEPIFEKNKGNINKYISSLTEEQKNKIRIIFGHIAFYGLHRLFHNRDCRYVTFIREPTNRTISHYNWDLMRYYNGEMSKRRGSELFPKGRKDLSFTSWFNNWIEEDRKNNLKMNNYIFRYLFFFFINDKFKHRDINEQNLERIKNLIDKFWFVGITENPEDFLFFYNKIGSGRFLRNFNVSTKYLGKKEVEKAKILISKDLEFDRKIYNYCLKQNRKFKKNHKFFFLIVLIMRIKKFFCFHLKLQDFPSFITSKFYDLKLFRLSSNLKKHSITYSKFVKWVKRKPGLK
ncbi:hypothetical protein CEE44_03170 [Candidatus Woesearchaeota archaeon B3_Woes]|nr:MAG: hypothetical protein CEE44_03170 [Candidatus Woesearchaeota archaeon B3_Woes]